MKIVDETNQLSSPAEISGGELKHQIRQNDFIIIDKDLQNNISYFHMLSTQFEEDGFLDYRGLAYQIEYLNTQARIII